jgi:hypothetical protein
MATTIQDFVDSIATKAGVDTATAEKRRRNDLVGNTTGGRRDKGRPGSALAAKAGFLI